MDLELNLVVVQNPRRGNTRLNIPETGIKSIGLQEKNNINNELYGFYNPF